MDEDGSLSTAHANNYNMLFAGNSCAIAVSGVVDWADHYKSCLLQLEESPFTLSE